MADGLGFICFGDLNVGVTHIPLKKPKGALGIGDNLLTVGDPVCLSWGCRRNKGLLEGMASQIRS